MKPNNKQILFELSYYSGITHLYKKLYGRTSGVISFHNILDQQSITDYHTNRVDTSIQSFKNQLDYLQQEFAILPASDIFKSSYEGFCLVFDDGMLNNYEIVFPILKEYGLTAIFAICPSLINNEIPFLWRDHIFLIVKQCLGNEILIPINTSKKKVLVTPTTIDEVSEIIKKEIIVRSFDSVEGFSAYKYIDELIYLNNIKDLDKGIDTYRYKPMDWSMVRQLTANGNIIASHTNTHPLLSKMTSKQIVSELKSSKHEIEQKIEEPVRCIVYPFGGPDAVNRECLAVAKDCGYEKGFINIPNNIFGNDPLAIPRFALPNTSSMPYISATVCGWRDRFKRITG